MSSDSDHKYSDMIQEFASHMVFFHQAVAERLGLHVTDLKCAGIIRRSGPLTGIELAKRVGLTGAAITKVVDRLEKAGLVQREKDLRDRRFMVIHSIPEAQEKVGQIYESFANSMGSLFASYSKEESKLIFDFIMRSSSILNEETAKLNKSIP